MWLKLKRQLQNHAGNINTADELSNAIRHEWQQLPVDYIQGLYRSIPKRIRKVISVKGEMTKY